MWSLSYLSHLTNIMIEVIHQLVYRFHVFIRWAMIPTYFAHRHSRMRVGTLAVGIAPFSSFLFLLIKRLSLVIVLIKALESLRQTYVMRESEFYAEMIIKTH